MRKVIILLCLAMLGIGVQAQDYDYMQRGRAAKKAGGEQLEAFKKEMAQLSKSKKEVDLLNASYGYRGMGEGKTAQALVDAAKKKFPRGIAMRGSDYQKLFTLSGGEAVEKAYKDWTKKYPVKKYGKDQAFGEATYAVASAYAQQGNAEKALAFAAQIEEPVWKSFTCYGVGSSLQNAGQKEAAGQLFKEGCEVADKVVPTLQGRSKKQAELVYTAYADWLADNGNADEAWQLYNSKVADKTSSYGYWKLALQHGQVMQAWTTFDKSLRKGRLGKDGLDLMKAAWTKANGTPDGFDQYVSQVNDERKEEMLAKIPEKMTNKPAPDFTLKDIDGNTVQLSKLRGKVVVLDFWATWCGPCKRSLPAMQKTMRRYKNDPEVEFLFIHTWERGTPEQANKEAKAYLHDNGFDDLHLVMDTKNPATGKNDAVTAFGVAGIPAKFIIDKQGNIRFEGAGFGGNDDDLVTELSRMIDLTKKAK